MSLLIRKIEQAKWRQKDILNGEEPSADAITNCMKTTKNTLSTWKIENEEQLHEAVLAIVSGHQHLDTIDVALINQDSLSEVGILLEQTPGLTPVNDLIESHIDITDLNYSKLGKISESIISCFKEDKIKRFTRAELKRILKNAIEAGRLNAESLSPSISDKL